MTDSEPPEYQPLLPAAELHRYLLGWYDGVKRDMPWRGATDPYAIWLSETMLQQTQVEAVKPYYARFLARFPTLQALAEAELEDVLSLWAGLGYYRRAKHLHQAARAVVESHGGALPATVEGLMRLPGVGRYTAGAVASIAFGVAAPVVDGNVMRVLARITGYDKDISEARNQPFFWKVAGEVVAATEDGRYGDVNQSLMELGATVCTPPPSRPACLLCPVKGFCRAYAEGRQLELPVKGKKAAVPVVRGTAVVLLRENASGREVLMMRRPMGCVWEGMWEVPVVGNAKGEARNAKQRRERWYAMVQEALGVAVGEVKGCGEVRHGLTHRAMRIEVVRGVMAGGKVVLPECATAGGKRYEQWRWVPWPLEVRGALPMARLVEKVAEAAVISS
jgi:A/G-specific adenine glycosylase